MDMNRTDKHAFIIHSALDFITTNVNIIEFVTGFRVRILWWIMGRQNKHDDLNMAYKMLIIA